jgi:hypothetical protein
MNPTDTDTSTDTDDPLELLRRLDSATLCQRLDALESEAQALRVLLRSARARENAARRQAVAPAPSPRTRKGGGRQ